LTKIQILTALYFLALSTRILDYLEVRSNYLQGIEDTPYINFRQKNKSIPMKKDITSLYCFVDDFCKVADW
jgi:hypothetical protein